MTSRTSRCETWAKSAISGTGQPCADANTIIARRNRTRSLAVRLIRCNRCPSDIVNGRTNTSGGRATIILPGPVITFATRMRHLVAKINYRTNQH